MSNIKKVVEARMKKTGEGWQTASRQVRKARRGGDRDATGGPQVTYYAILRGDPGEQVFTVTREEPTLREHVFSFEAPKFESDAALELHFRERFTPLKVVYFDGDATRVLDWYATFVEAHLWATDTKARELHGVLEVATKDGQVVWPREDSDPRFMRRSDGAQYITVRFNPTKRGHTFDAALAEARRYAVEASHLLNVAIRRTDHRDHPWVCQWTRREVADTWAPSWMNGAFREPILADPRDSVPALTVDAPTGDALLGGRVLEPDGREVYRGHITDAQLWHLNACGFSVSKDGVAVTSTHLHPALLGGRAKAEASGHSYLLVVNERKNNPAFVGATSAPTPEALREPGYALLEAFRIPVGMHVEMLVAGRWEVDLAYHFSDEAFGVG